jgi:NagD protein
VIDFSPYDAVLLDLDGTLYHDDHVLPAAPELIARLIREEINFACLSNSTSSPARINARLKRMGIEVHPDRIYTAALATCDYAMQHFGDGKRRPRIFNLATEGVHDMLDGRVDWVQTDGEPCDAIIAGAPTNVYAPEERQLTAIKLLRRGAALLGICADRVFPSPRGIEVGTGAFSWMLGYAANVEPVFCGKPATIFFEELCARISAVPSKCVLIGDNLESDVQGARRVGMKAILTLTGVTRRRDLATAPPELQPDMVIEDLTEA